MKGFKPVSEDMPFYGDVVEKLRGIYEDVYPATKHCTKGTAPIRLSSPMPYYEFAYHPPLSAWDLTTIKWETARYYRTKVDLMQSCVRVETPSADYLGICLYGYHALAPLEQNLFVKVEYWYPFDVAEYFKLSKSIAQHKQVILPYTFGIVD